MRSMVEGAHLLTPRHNPANNPVEVSQDVTSRYSHHGKTLFLQKRVPRDIAPRLIATIVPLPVNLDDQAMAKAGEVDGNWPNRKLRAELQPTRSPPQRR